jgi:hypothetical protein
LPSTAATPSQARIHLLFIFAVALGSFLIFLIQPLAARALLPAFGGSGSVWVTALVFYQVLLAVGYLLSHLLRTRLSTRAQTMVFTVLAAGTVLTLPVLPVPIDYCHNLPTVRLLVSLAVAVAPPFLVLAVAGPLVQSWAAETGKSTLTGRGVYSLYAVSNAASLLALVAYPTLVEPRWNISQQGRIWETLFVVEVVLLGVLAMGRFFSQRARTCLPNLDIPENQPCEGAEQPRILLWLCWSAAGVMVLTSTSGMIGQEIAAIPLLWVIPLVLYLVTWIVSFSGMMIPGRAARYVLALVALILIVLAVDIRLHLGCRVRLGLALTGMTLACLSVHATLYRLRPGKQLLTCFYAAIACGGALGGIVAGVVTVKLFHDWRDLGLAFSLVALLAVAEIFRQWRKGKVGPNCRVPAIGLVGLLAVLCWHLCSVTSMERPGLLYKHRDFHGLVRIVTERAENPRLDRLVLYHGTTVHGCQYLDPVLRREATTYFGRGSGAQLAVEAQRYLTGPETGMKIGAVGLGVGTLATHLEDQDTIRFYEISPIVAAVAQSQRLTGNPERHFSYLTDCPGKVDVVVGDARLSLDSELGQKPEGNAYDLLVLDAFAGDAVPVHLLTKEAFSLYTKHLSPAGMIAVHVSNNWVDLVPVVYAWADAEHWEALTISTRGKANPASGFPTVWVLLFRRQETLRILARHCRPLMASGDIMVQNRRNVDYGNLLPWTDEHFDLLTLMRSRIRLREG